ncbi:SDR family oxidoreductase [Veronia pacifica]|uniref:NAD(P)-dependent oxidoreductase n=1 Tax=Veronia pacifica TaxID=1080227 RepID=A0A1C3EPU8_9GAMM|nr:SDR family oxidoreductase [Veronia pacifica]ODA35219.1 NAD(P)-dependent oxidoreductase [Veronia pacifica]
MQSLALVTGASRGIGEATAIALAKQGHTVCINYRHQRQAAESVAEKISQIGGDAFIFGADISDEEEVRSLFSLLDKHPSPLRVLVNNAGILFHQSALADIAADRFHTTLMTNVIGPFLCCREATKRMSTQHGGGGGVIVNVSSAASRTGSPNEYVDYAASKGALDTMTVGLAKEVAMQGIRVNGVRPGLINTDIHASGGEPNRVSRLSSKIPLQRGGESEDVASAIAYLCSQEAAFVTGTFIDVTGGL